MIIVIFLATYNKIKSIWKYLMLQPSQFNLFLRIKNNLASFWQLQSQISFLGWHVCNPKWTSTSLEAPSASRMRCECWDAFLLTTFIRRGYLSYRSFSLSFSQPCHSPLASLINKVFLSFFFQTFLSKPCGLLKMQKIKHQRRVSRIFYPTLKPW